MHVENLSRMAEVAGILGHPVRLGIVTLLADQPANVTRLVQGCRAEQATVSKHLGILSSTGLLRCTPDGRCRVYSLVDETETRALLRSLQALAARATKGASRPKAKRSS